MYKMPIVDLQQRVQSLKDSGNYVSVMWQQPESLVFVARGRAYRSEFHINPSDEVMYQVKGEMRLHYRTPDDKEEVAVIPEGSMIHTPAGIPHSPRFAPDAYAVILERQRRPGEVDVFKWYCPACDALLHVERFVVGNYGEDPVAQAYRSFYHTEAHRTCKACGHVMPDALSAAEADAAAGTADGAPD
ncbi:MAG: 3-hydroxyanthranilate 3,4-dioxygenase [Janthinobacterium lividum]